MAIPVFHLAVVLEEGNIVAGRLQAPHAAELVVDLHPDLADINTSNSNLIKILHVVPAEEVGVEPQGTLAPPHRI